MTRKQTHTTVLAVAILALATLGSGVAVANHSEGGVLDDVLDDEGDSDLSARASGFVSGLLDRVLADAGPETAEAAAEDLTTEFNSHNETIQSYVNDRTDASTDADVLEVELVVDGETVTRYLVADVNGSAYENATMVSSTDREVDETCTLEGHAARNAGAELDRFVEKFAAEERNVSDRYKGELAGEYASSVSCTFDTGDT